MKPRPTTRPLVATIMLAIIAVSSGELGCIPKEGNNRQTKTTEPVTTTSSIQDLPLQDTNGTLQQNLTSIYQASLPRFCTAAVADELLFALAACNCAPRFTNQYFRSISTMPGALPQILIPIIRQEILSNEQLHMLDDLATNSNFQNSGNSTSSLVSGSSITNIISKIINLDGIIEKTVRTTIAKKISTLLPSAANMDSEQLFRFDGFTSAAIAKDESSSSSSSSSSSFSVQSQIPRWTLAFGHNGLWNNPIDSTPHTGFHMLEVLRSLVEWDYLFGLERGPTGRPYGGLTLSANLANNTLEQFDPRNNYTIPRFFSGRYQLSYVSGSILDVVKNGSETWAWAPQVISLREQASIWHTSALAFQRLRPRGRGSMSAAFGSTGALLPSNAHLLPLVILPAMEFLLKNALIDEKTRLIRNTAKLDYASVGASTTSDAENSPADLADLTILLNALSEWTSALTDLSDLNDLSQDNLSQLTSAPLALRRAAQLVAQTILGRYVSSHQATGGQRFAAIWANDKHEQVTDPTTAAKTISALIKAEQTMFNSPYLRVRLGEMLQWTLSQYFFTALETSAPKPPAETILWMMLALTRFSDYFSSNAAPNWLQPTKTAIAASISTWEMEAAR